MSIIIILALASIVCISALMRVANKILSTRLCPICAGIFLTWVGLVATYFAGYAVDPVIPAILMGGTVVGIAYQLEKKMESLSADKVLVFKVLFMPAGFVVAYGILQQSWWTAVIAACFAILLAVVFMSAGVKSARQSREASAIEKEMDKCC